MYKVIEAKKDVIIKGEKIRAEDMIINCNVINATSVRRNGFEIDSDNVLNTKGDILSHDGLQPVRVNIGLNGQILSADSTEISGIKWINSSSTIPSNLTVETLNAEKDESGFNWMLRIKNNNLTDSLNYAMILFETVALNDYNYIFSNQNKFYIGSTSVPEALKLDNLTGNFTIQNDLTVTGTINYGALNPPISTPLTTKGDIYTFDTSDTRLGLGTTGQFLQVDTSTTTGLKWNDFSLGDGTNNTETLYEIFKDPSKTTLFRYNRDVSDPLKPVSRLEYVSNISEYYNVGISNTLGASFYLISNGSSGSVGRNMILSPDNTFYNANARNIYESLYEISPTIDEFLTGYYIGGIVYNPFKTYIINKSDPSLTHCVNYLSERFEKALVLYEVSEPSVNAPTNSQYLYIDSSDAKLKKKDDAGVVEIFEKNKLTTKGDLSVFSTQTDRLGVGTNGQLLFANSTEVTGLEWKDPPFAQDPTLNQGDIIYRNSSGNLTRLALPSDNKILSVNTSTAIPEWKSQFSLDSNLSIYDQQIKIINKQTNPINNYTGLLLSSNTYDSTDDFAIMKNNNTFFINSTSLQPCFLMNNTGETEIRVNKTSTPNTLKLYNGATSTTQDYTELRFSSASTNDDFALRCNNNAINFWTSTSGIIARLNYLGQFFLYNITATSGAYLMYLTTSNEVVRLPSALIYKNVDEVQDYDTTAIYNINFYKYTYKSDPTQIYYSPIADYLNENETTRKYVVFKEGNPDGIHERNLWHSGIREIQKLRTELSAAQVTITNQQSTITLLTSTQATLLQNIADLQSEISAIKTYIGMN